MDFTQKNNGDILSMETVNRKFDEIVSQKTPNFENRPSFAKNYARAQFLQECAESIYYGTDENGNAIDPRNEACKDLLSTSMAELYGGDAQFYKQNYNQYMKALTGYDIDAKSSWEIFKDKTVEGFSNIFNVAIPNLYYTFDTEFGNYSELEKERLREKYDNRIAEGLKNRRTDYYKEFDGLFDQLLLSTGSFLPSMLPSIGINLVGAVLAPFTGGASSAIAIKASATWSALSEWANATLEMRQMGAEGKVALGFGAMYGLVAGIIENKAGEVMQNTMFKGIKEAGALHSAVYNSLEKGTLARTVKESLQKAGWEYASSYITEPTEEMLQDFAQNLITNWANAYQAKYGKPFTTEKGFKEMIESMAKVGMETLKGNVLLGVGTNVMQFTTSEVYGELSFIRKAKKLAGVKNGQKLDDTVELVLSPNIVVDKKHKQAKPNEEGSVGIINAYKTEFGTYIPVASDMDKASYVVNKANGKNLGAYINVVNNESSEGLTAMSEQQLAFTAFRNHLYEVDASVKDNAIYVPSMFFNSAIKMLANDEASSFGGVVDSDENSVTLKLGDSTVRVVNAGMGEYEGNNLETYFDSIPDELKTQYEKYKETIIEKEDLKNYEPTLEKAINAGKEEFRTGNKEFAQKINKDIADTLVKGGMKSKRAQIIANGSTVVSTRLANSLGISLEDFLGKYELTEQYREYTKDGSGYTVLPTEYTKTVDGKSETHTIRGHVDFANHILSLTDKADATTVVHEIGHIFLGRVGDYRNIKGFAENYREALIKDNTDKKGVLADEKNWKVGKETQEAFAEDFERYIASGEVANEGLRKIFEQLKKAILAIRTLFDEVLTEDKKRMFDELLGVETVADAIAEEEGLYESEDIKATEYNPMSKFKKNDNGTLELNSEDVVYENQVYDGRYVLSKYKETWRGGVKVYEKFSNDKIGSSAGTFYSWGGYVSEAKGVADSYARHALSNNGINYIAIRNIANKILNIISLAKVGLKESVEAIGINGISEDTWNKLEERISKKTGLSVKEVEDSFASAGGFLEALVNKYKEEAELFVQDVTFEYLEDLIYETGDSLVAIFGDEVSIEDIANYAKDVLEKYNESPKRVLTKWALPQGIYFEWDSKLKLSEEEANSILKFINEYRTSYSIPEDEDRFGDFDFERYIDMDEVEKSFISESTFGELYNKLVSLGISAKDLSLGLWKLGYKGVVVPIGRNHGRHNAQEGEDYNFVLWNPEEDLKYVTSYSYDTTEEIEGFASEDITPVDSNIHNLEDRLTHVLTQGGFISREEMDALQDASATYKALSKALGVDKDLIELTADDLIKTEDFIIALYHDKPELIDKAEEAIQTIAKRRKLTTEEFTNKDWKDAGSIWNKSLKDEIHDDERVRKLLSWTMKRINDYINMDNAEADRQAWLNTFRDTQRGRTALNQFVKDLYNKTDYLKGGAIETGDMSMGERFPNLAMLANTLNRGNIAVSESLRERARKEIADNVGFFRDAYLRINGMSAKADLEMSQNTASETISKNEQRYDFSKWIMDSKLPKEIRKAIDSKKYTKEVADYMIRQFKEEMALNERRNAEIQTLKERIKRRDGDIEELKQKIRDIRAEQKKVVLRLKEESRLQVVYEQMRRSIDAVKTRIKNTARSAGDVKSKHALTRIYNVLSKRQSMGYSLFNDFYTREYFEENASSTFNFLLDNGLIDDNGVVQKGLNRFAVPRFETEIKQNGSVISFFDTYTKEHVDGMLQAFRADAVEKQQQKAYESQKRKNETLKVSNKASSELGEITDLEEKIDRRIADLKAQEGYDEARSGRLAKRMELLKQQHENDGDDSYTDADAERDANSILDEMERDEAENFVRTQEQSITKGSRTEEEKNSGVGNMGKKLFNFIHNPRILIKRISPTLHDVIFGFGGKGRKHVTIYNLDGTKQEYDGNYGLNQYENYTWRNADARIDETNRRIAEVFNINETDPRKLTKKVRESLIKKFLKNNGTITALTGTELEDALGRFCDEGQLRTFGYTVENGVVIKDHDTSYDSIGETTDEFTIEDLIGIYIRTKNKEGMTHLVGGNRISLGQIMAVRKMFEDSGEYSEARQVADIINEEVGKRFDAIADIAYRLKNVELHKIPFYYPNISAERQVVFDVASSEFQKTHKLTDYFIFEQLGGDTAVDLNVLSGMEFAIIAQEKYIAGAEMFENFDELLNGEGKLLSKIEATHGKQSRKMIEDFISINKSRVRSDLDEVGKALGFLRSNMAIAKLGFNFSSILQQWASIPLMLSRYNIGEIVSSLIRMINGGRAYADQFIYAVSPQMKRRNSYDVGVAKDINAYKSKFSALRAKIGEAGMYVMEKCDHFMADWMFDVAYQHNLAQGMDAEQAEIDAVQWVMDTQSNSSPKNNPLLYSTSNDLVKTILLFTNQLNKQYNMLAGAVMEGGLKNIFRNVLAVGLSVMAVSLLTGKPLPEDDNDDVLKKFLIGCEAELMGMVPILGSTAKGIVEGSAFTGTNIVIVDQAQKAGKLIQALREDDAKKRAKKTKTAMKNLLYSAEDLFALPSVATKRFVQGWELMKDGKGIGSLPMSQFGTEYRKYWESR